MPREGNPHEQALRYRYLATRLSPIPAADDRRGLAGLGRPADNSVLGIGLDASRRVDVIEAREERFVMTSTRSTETAPAASNLRVPVGVIIAIAPCGHAHTHQMIHSG
jgi:hypothetical protein